MTIRILNGLAEVASDYDMFIFDLWGVIHDGEAAYPDAVDCLRRLRQQGARIELLSNAARLSDAVAAHLAKLGVTEDLYDGLLTSGDATVKSFAADESEMKPDDWPAFFHIGPDRCRPTLKACGGREAELDEADVVLCTGLFDDETEEVEDYLDLLTALADLEITLICVNPDMYIVRGGRKIPCAGALAAQYEQLGGVVLRVGKPLPYIFDCVFETSPDIPRVRTVMIGDSLSTDIGGAKEAGIDAVWIGGGIHAEVLGIGPDGPLQSEKVHAVAEEAGEHPKAILPWLKW